jgi:hypothetical protein
MDEVLAYTQIEEPYLGRAAPDEILLSSSPKYKNVKISITSPPY